MRGRRVHARANRGKSIDIRPSPDAGRNRAGGSSAWCGSRARTRLAGQTRHPGRAPATVAARDRDRRAPSSMFIAGAHTFAAGVMVALRARRIGLPFDLARREPATRASPGRSSWTIGALFTVAVICPPQFSPPTSGRTRSSAGSSRSITLNPYRPRGQGVPARSASSTSSAHSGAAAPRRTARCSSSTPRSSR